MNIDNFHFFIFLIHKQTIALSKENILIIPPKLKVPLKIFALVILLIELFYPYRNTKVWNDDKVPRPYLHGAYQITNSTEYKRKFIHRKGSLIVQKSNNFFLDYSIILDSATNTIIIDDENKRIKGNFKKLNAFTIYFELPLNNDSLRLTTTTLPYRNLPIFF